MTNFNNTHLFFISNLGFGQNSSCF